MPVKPITINDNSADFRALNKALQSSGVLPDQIKAAMTAAGNVIADEARRRAPKASGKLAGSVKVYGAKDRVRVRAGSKTVPYAYTFHAVALGKSAGGFTYKYPAKGGRRGYTRQAYIPNRPFLIDAFKATKAECFGEYVQAMAKALGMKS